MKTKIYPLSYNAMFKAVIANNKYLVSLMVKMILDTYNFDIDITNKELVMKYNELTTNNIRDKQFVCDYIIKIDEENEINIELNRASYKGLVERNLSYSFNIYYSHFKSGDKYNKMNRYNLLQVNYNRFPNPNKRTINKFFILDVDDFGNILTNNFSILNIDIEKCHEMVYNNDNLEGISDFEVFSGILNCEYLEDITSILERRSLGMNDKERSKFVNDIKVASEDKDTWEAVKLEETLEDRFAWIEAFARADERDKSLAEGLEQGIEQGIEQGREEGREEAKDDMVKSMLSEKLSYEVISKVTGKSIDYIKSIEEQ